MKINQLGLDLIKQFEGLRLRAYQDSVGVWTIGYGHTGHDVHPDQRITDAEAEALLAADLHRTEQGVIELLHGGGVTANQFAALVSFAFNLGIGALAGSTLLKLFNHGDVKSAAGQFLLWNHAGGHVLSGLTRRREAERELFLKP